MSDNSVSKTNIKLGIISLALMNVAAVISLRALARESMYGLSSAFYYLFAALVFLIPTALVAAELTAMFSTKRGGIFRWVGEALGSRLGFLAIWLQWIQNTIWYPTVLTFGATSFAFIGLDHFADARLASDPRYTLTVVLILYWLATFISLKGFHWVEKVSKIGAIIGTIIPGGLLIVLAAMYLISGGYNNMDMTQSFFPDLSNIDNLVLASSIFLFYGGLEMMGIHALRVDNPSKNFPKAIFIGAVIIVVIFISGTFAIGIITPKSDINITQSLIRSFDSYFSFFNIDWLASILSMCLLVGVLAGVLTWISGPSRGIYNVGRAGFLPPFFQKSNNVGVQKNILYVQGAIVTVLNLFFMIMPSVQSFFQIMSQLAVLLYLVMYMLMFGAAIKLRYKFPTMPRPFRIGRKGNWLIWIVASLGFLSSLFAFALSFIPPNQIYVGSRKIWFTILIIGAVTFIVTPFVIYANRKESWKNNDEEFEPFSG